MARARVAGKRKQRNWSSDASNVGSNGENEPNRANTGPQVVVPAPNEHNRECLLLEKRRVKGGWGVFARRPIRAWQPLLVYPGRVFYNRDWNNMYPRGSTDRRFAVGFFRVRPDGSVRRDLTLDPSPPADGGALDPLFAPYMAPYLNEPSKGERANAVWVTDVPAHKLMVYSLVDIPAGAEVLVCYGPSASYKRNYRTPCTLPPQSQPLQSSAALFPESRKVFGLYPTDGYQVLYPGMTTQLDGKGHRFPLDRVHPRSWAEGTSRLVRTRFGDVPLNRLGQRLRPVSRAYDTDNERCAGPEVPTPDPSSAQAVKKKVRFTLPMPQRQARIKVPVTNRASPAMQEEARQLVERRVAMARRLQQRATCLPAGARCKQQPYYRPYGQPTSAARAVATARALRACRFGSLNANFTNAARMAGPQDTLQGLANEWGPIWVHAPTPVNGQWQIVQAVAPITLRMARYREINVVRHSDGRYSALVDADALARCSRQLAPAAASAIQRAWRSRRRR